MCPSTDDSAPRQAIERHASAPASTAAPALPASVSSAPAGEVQAAERRGPIPDLHRLGERRGQSVPSSTNSETLDTTTSGRIAESLAAAYLQLRGFRILDRNVRVGHRELDLIAECRGWLVVVEVRFRGALDHGLPEESIHPGKRTHLHRAGETWWLRHGRGKGPLRFDLVALSLTSDGLRLRHYPHFLRPGSR